MNDEVIIDAMFICETEEYDDAKAQGKVFDLVRCRDCKYNKGKNKCLNEHSIIDIPKDDDYCSYGERKE